MGTSGRRSLEVRLLGELEVVRDGRLVALPQSKKTRALLAYLVLTERQHRRDHLCSLLWDVADDPRGALRWSLSKLRTILDAPEAVRIRADRDRISFEARDAIVDALLLRKALATRAPSALGADELESLAAMFRGEPLDGLDLADFDDYQAWCVGERERARALRASILAELTRRLSADPKRAVEHASHWVRIDPMDETARATLIRLLGALGRREEARQHYTSGRRLDKELGRHSRGELEAAWRAIDQGETPVVYAAPEPAPQVAPAASVQQGPPLVGRERELAALDAHAADVANKGSLAVVLLSGEAGVGKTRLLSEWTKNARKSGSIVLEGASFEAETGHPYAPWRDALAATTEANPFTSEPGAGTTRERLFARAAEIIERLGERARSSVIVLDDVQWIDEGSAELLHWIARTNRHRPVLVLLSARDGEIADNAAILRVTRGFRRESLLAELAIGPLGKEPIESLVHALGSRADPNRVLSQSGGNALFAIEIARAGAATDEIPATLSGLVRDRIAQLPPDAADVLRWASVLGGRTNVAMLDELSTMGADAVVAALEQLEARSLLLRGPDQGFEYVFAHDVVRRIVYADISEPRRRLMHQRVAVLLASRSDSDSGAATIADLAHHAALAHDSRLAAEACLGAARRSLRLFANADALTLARRGARHAEQLEEPSRTRRIIELAEVQFAARRPHDVAEAAAQMRALAERALDHDLPEHARLAFHILSYLSWETGGWADAERHMREAERVSRGASERERVRGLAEAARCLVLLERDLGHAQALALEAAARAKHAGIEPPATFDALGMLALHQGNIEEATSKLEHARALARADRNYQDEFQSLEHLVATDIERGDLQSARLHAQELVVLAERFREGSEAPFARSLVALTHLRLGVHDADAALEREIEALTVTDAKHRLAYVLTRSALFDLEAGRVDVARRRAERALAIGEILARPTEMALALVILVRCARSLANSEDEARHRRALETLSGAPVAASVRMLVEELDA